LHGSQDAAHPDVKERILKLDDPATGREKTIPLSVSIIIPAYNEEQAVGEVVRQLKCRYPNHEILVVDDGSADATAERAAAAGARVIRHPVNRGYGSALSSGIRAVRSDVVVFVDADGQHEAGDVERLLSAIETCDMAVGSRTGNSHVELRRVSGKKVLKWFADYLARERIPDVNSGFRACRRDVLLRYLHLMPEGFSFSTTCTFAMLKGRRRISWIPIETRKRIGTSTVSQLKNGPQTIMLMLRLTVLFDPPRIFLPISGLMMLLAGVVTLVNFIYFRPAVPATGVFLAISAVIVFMLGLVTDQISALRREMHDRD
jgi:glycosyltransferase involved in cell wall biosynthesis